MRRFLKSKIAIIVAALSLLLVPAAAHATDMQPNLTQTINAGALTADFFQTTAGTTAISSPVAAFSAENTSFNCQTSTGTLADGNSADSGYLIVTNLASGKSSWNVSIAATGGDSATWTSGSDHYSYNTATGSGCTSGQMTVDPSTATLADDCGGSDSCSGNASTVTKGSSTAFVSGTTSSATLFSDSAGTAWEGYLENIGLSQKVPALTPSGSYALPMTVTLAST